MMTGVVPAYRGVGSRRREGAREIWTHNDSGNAPMLAINRKPGYRPVPGWFRLVLGL